MKMGRLLGLVLSGLMLMTGYLRAADIAKPSTLPGAMATVTVSDLHGFIDGMGKVTSQFSPTMNGETLTALLGVELGDPDLSGIPPGKGLAMVMMDPTNVFVVVEALESQLPTYTAALSDNGMQSRYSQDVLIVAPGEEQVALGVGLVSAVKETLLSRRTPELKITTRPASIIEENREDIEGLLDVMPEMMNMLQAGTEDTSLEGAMKILQAEIGMLLSIAGQCDTFEISMIPTGTSIQIAETIAARPSSPLAALLNAPAVNQPNSVVRAGLAGDAAIAIEGVMANPDALTAFMCNELEPIMKAFDLDADTLASWDEMMKSSMGLYAGSFSETLTFGGDSFMNLAYVVEIKDEDAALEYLKKSMSDIAPMLALYENLGMPMTMEFKEDAREHSGVKIHQFKVAIDMPDEQMAALEAMNMNLSNMSFDIALCNHLMLYTMGETKIETLIDRVRDEDFDVKPLQARQVYPDGGFYYCDVDVAKYLSGLGSIIPQDPSNPLPQMAVMLSGAEPVTSAGFQNDGSVMWSINLPVSLMVKISEAVEMLQEQQMNQIQIEVDSVPLAAPIEAPAEVTAEVSMP